MNATHPGLTQGSSARPRRNTRINVWLRCSLLAPLIALIGIQQARAWVPWHYVLVPLAAALLFGVWRTWRRGIDLRLAFAGSVVFGAALLLAEMPVLLRDTISLSSFAMRAAPVFCALAVLLWLHEPPALTSGGRIELTPTQGRSFALILSLATLGSLALLHWWYAGRFGVQIDGNLYVLQSSYLTQPGYVRHIDPELQRFFVMRQSIFQDGRFYTQYPPGWPAILALFDALGARWWTVAAMGACAAFFTALIGSRVFSPLVGVIGAALLVTTAEFLVSGSGYASHLASLAVTTLAAWLLLRAEDHDGWWRNVHWLMGGFAIGLVTLMRPMSGVTIGLSLLAWLAARRRWHPKTMLALAGFVALGGLGPVLMLLHYNQVTNGAPLLFGYSAANGHLHDFGFGVRGMIAYDDAGNAVPVTTDFTPGLALSHALRVFFEFNTQVVPLFLGGTIVVLGWMHRYRYRWGIIAAFLILPIMHFFWYYAGVRFVTELFAFVSIGLASIIVHLLRRNWRMGAALLACFAIAQVTAAGMTVREGMRRNRPLRPYFERVMEAKAEYGQRLLVFVDEPPLNEGVLEGLAWFNQGRFPSTITVARDLGALDTVLINRLPGHVPLRTSAVKREAPVPPLQPVVGHAPARPASALLRTAADR